MGMDRRQHRFGLLVLIQAAHQLDECAGRLGIVPIARRHYSSPGES